MTLKADLAPDVIPEMLRLVASDNARTRDVSHEIDARHCLCPLPLLKAKQGLRNLVRGDLLRVLATDAGSLKDFVSFAQLTQQSIEAFQIDQGEYCYIFRKQ